MRNPLRISWLLIIILPAQSLAAELKVLLPQQRVAYQTNELITVSVVRSNIEPLPATDLTVTVSGQDGSRLAFAFPLGAVAIEGNRAQATEHLSFNGRLLRPGKYTIEVAAHDATAKTEIEIYSHVRKSSYRIVHWGSPAANEQQALMGEDGLGYNLLMNSQPPGDNMVRAGLDFMGTCLMGGMHQHDGRIECDWSDPYVTGGAVQRAMVRAYPYRTWGNMIGAHLHDEPGLTYANHPRTGKFVPYDVPQQRAAYRRVFAEEPTWYDEVQPDRPESLAGWTALNDFRLRFMDAFWLQARFALEKMKPGYLSVTQSQYAWWALPDGHYFNVARSLPVICGHGGYDDYYLMSLNPVWFLESSLPRQMEQPTWYLPEWFHMPSEKYRLEHYMCFATGIAGLCTPPPFTPWEPNRQPCTDGILESNKLMASLGTIFARPAITRSDVAILFSKSALWYAVAKAKSNRDHEQTEKLAQVYLATKMSQYPTNVVLDEDVIDGTLAANHKAVILSGLQYVDPAVKSALERFAAAGGFVLMTDDCTLNIAGAAKIGARNDRYWNARERRIAEIQDPQERAKENARARALVNWCNWCQPLAKALKASLLGRGIRPALETDARGLAAARQRRGEIEYLFAINFTPTEDVSNAPSAIKADVALPLAGRSAYDAVRGGSVAELDSEGKGTFRFGPGQMRVFALTARPIGGVQVAPGVISADLSRDADPITVELAVILRDAQGGLLCGTAPLRIKVIDPLGVVRYDLYRATESGVLKLKLPLAVNDPAGEWKVAVRVLLSGTEAAGSFTYRPATVCGAAAGAIRRALMFPPDRENIYALFQSHKSFTMVRGSGEAVAAAALRIAENLEPYDVHCTIVDAANVKTRPLTEEEKKTWTSYGGGANDTPLTHGFDLPGPAILIGNAQNNPVLAVVAQPKKWHPQMPSLMPYEPGELVPGPGRAMIGWHMYPIGRRLETVTLLADDARGLSEAAGALTEIVAGLQPLTPLGQPSRSSVIPATKALSKPREAVVAWECVLPDRALSIDTRGDHIVVTTLDGSSITIDAHGNVVSRKVGPVAKLEAPPTVNLDTLAKEKMPAGRIAKWTATGADATAVGYWGGTLQIVDEAGKVLAQQQLPQDIAAMAWHGKQLIVGLADGRLAALSIDGI